MQSNHKLNGKIVVVCMYWAFTVWLARAALSMHGLRTMFLFFVGLCLMEALVCSYSFLPLSALIKNSEA